MARNPLAAMSVTTDGLISWGTEAHRLYPGKMRNALQWRPDLLTISFLVILLGGTLVRFIGLDFGLPLTTKSDEGLVVNGAIDMVERRSFEPDRFEWPNHLGIMATYLAYVFITPLWHGILVEQAINEVEIGYFHLVSRGVSASFGVVGIVLAYFIGKRFNKIVGVFAAAFFAFMPPYVEESHYATPDIVLTAAILAGVLAAMVYVSKPTIPLLLVMSLMSTLSIMAKYPGALATVVIAAVVIAAAVRDRAWTRIIGHGLISVAAVPLFLFILSPVMFTNRHVVLRRITHEARSTHLGADGLNFPEKLVFYADNYFTATGVILLLLSVAGVWYLIRHWTLEAIPLFIGGVFWVALSTLGLHWARWGLPMYITPLILAALGAYFVLTTVQSRWPANKLPSVGVAVVLVIALVTQVVASVAQTAQLMRPDTRVMAYNEFLERGITRDNTLYEGYTPFRERWFDILFDDVEERDGKLTPLDPAIEYVVIGPMQARFSAEPERYSDEMRIYALIEEQYEVLDVYAPESPGSAVPFSNLRLMAAIQSIGSTVSGATGGTAFRLYVVPEELRAN